MIEYVKEVETGEGVRGATPDLQTQGGFRDTTSRFGDIPT